MLVVWGAMMCACGRSVGVSGQARARAAERIKRNEPAEAHWARACAGEAGDVRHGGPQVARLAAQKN